jgi:hypothetical protein
VRCGVEDEIWIQDSHLKEQRRALYCHGLYLSAPLVSFMGERKEDERLLHRGVQEREMRITYPSRLEYGSVGEVFDVFK